MKQYLLPALAALFILSCSSGSKAEPEIPFVDPGEKTDPTPAEQPSVVTGDATNITSTAAKIVNKYSGAPSSGAYDRGVYYGTSADALSQQVALNSNKGTSGTFNVQLVSLEPKTTYYYQAYITVWSTDANKYVDVLGSVKSFTTEDGGGSGGEGGGGSIAGLQYLGCYEMPAIDLKNTSACSGSGPETWGTTKWYNYLTSNDNQMVVTHTYSYDGKQYRNWTALVDKTKKAPLWNAFVMHKEAYPNNSVGRWDKKGDGWREDPGIPGAWQQCSAQKDENNDQYSRGHFCASEYRQTDLNTANAQTFYYTNQALQEQDGFNGALWARLEQDVSSHAPSGRDTLYVVVGVLYKDSRTLGGVPCPSHFYKCLMKCSFDASGAMTAAKGCAYLFTNVSHKGESYPSGITTIDAIEQRSGWDFFTNVPADLQATAEAQSASIW